LQLKWGSKDCKVIIVTGDRDAYQLVRDGIVTVYMPPRKNDEAREYGPEDVVEAMGVNQIKSLITKPWQVMHRTTFLASLVLVQKPHANC
jgi:5'-3' exonuclease